MNSRLDWLVLSDYYSIYVTNAPPVPRTRQRLRNQIKGLTKTVMPFFVGCFTRRDTLHIFCRDNPIVI